MKLIFKIELNFQNTENFITCLSYYINVLLHIRYAQKGELITPPNRRATKKYDNCNHGTLIF